MQHEFACREQPNKKPHTQRKLLASVLVEICALFTVPVVLVWAGASGFRYSVVLSFFVVCAALLVMFVGFEYSRPGLRQIMPAVVLGALGAAGRVLFAPFPSFKPVSAVVILAGVVFGRRCGFMVGALAAFVSNFFFGHGPWTPWQMYAWGLIGYGAGVLASCGVLGQRKAPVFIYGFLSAFGYGIILDSWHIVGYVSPLTWESALVTYSLGLPLNLTHACATVVFLAVIYLPWQKKLTRIREKYALLSR